MVGRLAIAVALSGLLASGTAALAVTAKEKAATCKFGADDQKLTGAARKTFLLKCMANDDAPEKQAKPKAAKPKPQT
jgi:hypothetical protein